MHVTSKPLSLVPAFLLVLSLTGAHDPTLARTDGLTGSDIRPDSLESQLVKSVPAIVAATVRIETEDGLGSGTLISDDGKILTSAHVIEGCAHVTCTLADGRRFAARVLGINSAGDLALLEIDAPGITSAILGDPSTIRRKDWIVAAGHPTSAFDDFQPTVSVGVVHQTSSFIRTDNADKVFRNVFEVDAPISPGSSGGGLWSPEGRLIGVCAAVTQFEHRAFAVKISEFLRDAERLAAGEVFDRRPEGGRSRPGGGGFAAWTRTDWFRNALPEVQEVLAKRSVELRHQDGTCRGFVVSADGDILTSTRGSHPFVKGARLRYSRPNEPEYDAEIAAVDLENAVALVRPIIRLEGKQDCFDLDRMADVRLGHLALSLSDGELTGGMVGALHRTPPLALTGEFYWPDVTQVDLRLGRQSIGGAVVDRGGNLIGMIVQYRLGFTESRFERDPFGAFILPVSKLRESYANLSRGVDRGARHLGFLGAELVELEETQKSNFGVAGGVLVGSQMQRRGPAYRSGIRPGDVIVAIGGESVHSRATAIARIVSYRRGQKVDFTVVKSGGERESVTVEMAERSDY